jgi:hypothetical protein
MVGGKTGGRSRRNDYERGGRKRKEGGRGFEKNEWKK